MGTKLLGPCGQGDVEKAEPPAEGLGNVAACGFGLGLKLGDVFSPGVDAAAQRVDVAEATGAQGVDCLRGVEDGDTCSGSAMAHIRAVALRKDFGSKRSGWDLGPSPSAAILPRRERIHSGGDVILAGPHGSELSRRPAEFSALQGLGEQVESSSS